MDACRSDLTVEDMRRWLEGELARLRLEADDLVRAYFREGRERSYSQKVWPGLKDYNGRSFYVIWCRREYVNPKRGVVRTQHISRGPGSYRKRLAQMCRHLEPEEQTFVLGCEDRFQEIRGLAEFLVNMLSLLDRYQSRKEKKEQKNVFFGTDVEAGSC